MGHTVLAARKGILSIGSQSYLGRYKVADCVSPLYDEADNFHHLGHFDAICAQKSDKDLWVVVTPLGHNWAS